MNYNYMMLFITQQYSLRDLFSSHIFQVEVQLLYWSIWIFIFYFIYCIMPPLALNTSISSKYSELGV